jgi:hypothetical protein
MISYTERNLKMFWNVWPARDRARALDGSGAVDVGKTLKEIADNFGWAALNWDGLPEVVRKKIMTWSNEGGL